MGDTKNPYTLVRVKDPVTGSQFSASRRYAEAAGFEILEGKPARDKWGRAIPVKNRVNLSSSATHAEIDAAAAEAGVDLSSAKTKSEKLAALAADTPKEA